MGCLGCASYRCLYNVRKDLGITGGIIEMTARFMNQWAAFRISASITYHIEHIRYIRLAFVTLIEIQTRGHVQYMAQTYFSIRHLFQINNIIQTDLAFPGKNTEQQGCHRL